MRFFIALFLSAQTIAATAQIPFSGRVLDGQSRVPLAGVSVSVEGQLRTTTSTDGWFHLFADSAAARVTLSIVGYRPLTAVLSADSTRNRFLLPPVAYELTEVVVHAYESDRRTVEVPAAVATLSRPQLERYAGVSLVPALNTLPGVRMEERSPGSYRLSIRGSTLRSPFGVRNVKVYWNGIPFTDPGGNTYLQAFDQQSIGRIEVIKGPAGSLYGAGTGGAVLLESPDLAATREPSQLRVSTTVGSYGLRSYGASLETRQLVLNYSNLSADGYRQQSAMRREVLSLSNRFSVGTGQTLSTSVLYSDLYYQTPGGLTLAQFQANPRQARPAGGGNPGAAEQQARFRIKTAYLGGAYDWAITSRWNVRSAVYGTFSQVENPAIRNWERRAEQSVGGRVTTGYRFGTDRLGGKLTAGAEVQSGFFNVKDYGNRRGVLDTLQTDEEITYRPTVLFAQAEIRLPSGWQLTGGLSYNSLNLTYTRLYRPAAALQRRRFDPVLSPRLAVLKKFAPNLSAYASISSGFSPPTVAEVRPSVGSFNATLAPERGTNYEAGVKGNLLGNRLLFEVTGYRFNLNETIVVRRADDGADYFVNAGLTRQNGLEISTSYAFWKTSKVWATYALQAYRFGSYVNASGDFSGNQLTGTPRQILTVGTDLAVRAGFYTNVTFNYTDRTPLNDSNADFAPVYALLGGKIGYKRTLGRLELDAFAGLDNALDQRYTPAPDLNAVGGRFYNAAPGRNYYGGIKVGIKGKGRKEKEEGM